MLVVLKQNLAEGRDFFLLISYNQHQEQCLATHAFIQQIAIHCLLYALIFRTQLVNKQRNGWLSEILSSSSTDANNFS